MRPLPKLIRVRRKDMICLFLLWFFSLVSLGSCALSAYFCFFRFPVLSRRFDLVSSVVTNYMFECKEAVTVYSSVLSSVRDDVLSLSSSGTTNDVSRETVLGTGRVRTSSGRFVPYVDVRLIDGQVERRYQR